jgi:hypothetical protein
MGAWCCHALFGAPPADPARAATCDRLASRNHVDQVAHAFIGYTAKACVFWVLTDCDDRRESASVAAHDVAVPRDMSPVKAAGCSAGAATEAAAALVLEWIDVNGPAAT